MGENKVLKRWREIDIGLPIYPKDIKDFQAFGNNCRFGDYNSLFKDNHLGLDFGPLYYSKEGIKKCLDKSTPIRAVADGRVQSIQIPGICRKTPGGYYNQSIILRHGLDNFYEDCENPGSIYCHVVPIVMVGDNIKKGQVIATPYDEHEDDTWVAPNHLHLEMGLIGHLIGNEVSSPYLKDKIDPMKVIPLLKTVFREVE